MLMYFPESRTTGKVGKVSQHQTKTPVISLALDLLKKKISLFMSTSVAFIQKQRNWYMYTVIKKKKKLHVDRAEMRHSFSQVYACERNNRGRKLRKALQASSFQNCTA